MGKPSFIRGLLEEVGAAAAFDPIDVVRRIPEGLEIPGLKSGIQRLVREFEIQMSISEGVARVLRGEVSMGMDTLRAGRKKGVRFEVKHENARDVDLAVVDPPTQVPNGEELPVPHRLVKNTDTKSEVAQRPAKPGHCVGCDDVFHEDGMFSPRSHQPKACILTFRAQRKKLSSASHADTSITSPVSSTPTPTLMAHEKPKTY